MKTSIRPRLLAIDDTPENLLTLALALSEDYDVQLASSGHEGLMLAEKSPPAIILLDVMMPETDGFEVCRILKRNPRLKNVPVVFLTALSDLDSEVEGLQLGASDYITKPINIKLVKQRINNLYMLTKLTENLRVSEERVRLVMDAIDEGLWDWNIDEGTVIHNAAWCRMFNLDSTFISHPVNVFFDRIHFEDLTRVRQAINESLVNGDPYLCEYRLKNSNGEYDWVLDRGKVVKREDNGRPVRMVGSLLNINQRKFHEAQIESLAYFDPLTKLPNRRLFLDRLRAGLAKCKRSKAFGALMYLDVDNFKSINDTHGHSFGDQLLILFSNRVRDCLREVDTVSRIGGDEFTVILEDIPGDFESSAANAISVAEKISSELNKPFQIDSLSFVCTPSIGISLFSEADASAESVIDRADSSMYEAKKSGKNTIRISG